MAQRDLLRLALLSCFQLVLVWVRREDRRVGPTGLVQEREQRGDELWVKVLPGYSASDEDAQWVRQEDIRGSG